MDKIVTVRYDEGRNEFVLNTQFAIPGLPEIEASGDTLSEAFQTLAEYLQEAGA